jgi:hypothetical protein
MKYRFSKFVHPMRFFGGDYDEISTNRFAVDWNMLDCCTGDRPAD